MAKIDGLQDEKVGPAFQMCWRIGNQHSLDSTDVLGKETAYCFKK